MTETGIEITTTFFANEHSIILSNWPNDWAKLWALTCTLHLTVCPCHITCAFQSESKFDIFLNVKELLGANKRDIWSLSDCNGSRTHNHLVFKWTLKHLAKMTIWLSWVVNTYLYGALKFMFLSCDVGISEWIHTLYLPECQGNLCSTQTRYLKLKWLQRDWNPQPLSL